MPRAKSRSQGVDAEALVEGLKRRGHRAAATVADAEALADELAGDRASRATWSSAWARATSRSGRRGWPMRSEADVQADAGDERRLIAMPDRCAARADAQTRRWRRWSGSRPAARPTGCSSRRTSTTSPTSCAALDPAVPVMALGLGSNLIVRDGGVPGVVVRLGKAFAKVEALDATTLALRRRGERHPGLLDRARRRHRRARVPARDPRHGRRLRADERRRLWPRDGGHAGRVRRRAALGRAADAAGWRPRLHLSPFASCPRARSSCRRDVPRACRASPTAIRAEMDRIAAAREAIAAAALAGPAARPSRTREGHKAWQLVDEAGCRGLTARRRAGEREAHQLPDQHRRRDQRRHRGAGRGSAREVKAQAGVTLEWEIQRVGRGRQ